MLFLETSKNHIVENKHEGDRVIGLFVNKDNKAYLIIDLIGEKTKNFSHYLGKLKDGESYNFILEVDHERGHVEIFVNG